MHEDMKSMLEQNITATSTMIQSSISAAFSSTSKGKSGLHTTALGLGRVEHSSASNADAE
eukprot:7655029-Ditylum_brightwellii.AAC.1